MAVWFMRLPCADPKQTADGGATAIGSDVIALPLREEIMLSRAAIATDAGRMGAPTNTRRYDVLRQRVPAQASIHEGAVN